MGICTIGDLQELSIEYLEERFGKNGVSLLICRGIDDRPVEMKNLLNPYPVNTHSMLIHRTGQWQEVLFSLVQDVSKRARSYGVKDRLFLSPGADPISAGTAGGNHFLSHKCCKIDL